MNRCLFAGSYEGADKEEAAAGAPHVLIVRARTGG